ncbi:MAG: PilZ domain-containing protein [Candidatus Anammoxibacter sp.]
MLDSSGLVMEGWANMTESREQKRFDVSLNVYGVDGKFIGTTKDISSSGCFLETNKNLGKDIANISIEMPGTLGLIKMNCKIVRKEKSGVGIKLFLDDNDRNVFSQLKDFCVY